jgi:DNA-binding NarL/FixJ family response regulator
MNYSPVHIFIVEDDKIFPNLLEYIFTKETRFRFLNFNCGEDCISNLHLAPDIILLDHALPGMNGKEVLLKVKQHNKDTDVVMLLNKIDEGEPQKLFEAGAADVIMKDEEGMDQIIKRLDYFLMKNAASPPSLTKKPSIGDLKVNV